MIQEILAKQVPLYQVLLLSFYALPSGIAMAAPFASLMGTLMTIGRLSSDNEVLIMLASGFSYRMIFFPALAVGIFVSLISFAVNDVLLPAGTIEFYKLYRQILFSTPALELEANSVKRFKETVIVTGPVTGRAIDNILILDRTSDGERRIIMASNARLIDDGREGLSLDLAKAFIQSSKEIVRNDYDYAFTDILRYWIPQEDIMQSSTTVSAREMSSVDLRREIDRRANDLDIRLDERYGRVLDNGLILEDTLRKGPSNEAWNRRESSLESFNSENQGAASARNNWSLLVHKIEYYKKFSIPISALSFVFLAVSIGLMAKKSGQTVGFVFGLIISAFYWTLLLAGQTLGLRLGYSPMWSMWMPNILAFSVGLVLFVIRIRK